MNDVEAALSRVLVERAERLAPAPGHRAATLGRARRRRITNAVSAIVVAAGLVTASFGALGAFDRRGVAPAGAGLTTTSGPYGFTSRPGEYPFAATGEFRHAQWQLRVAAVNPGRDADLRLTLQIRGPVRELTTSTSPTRDLDGPLYVRYERSAWLFDDGIAMVFGAAVPQTESVVVELESGDRFEAHLFEEHDALTPVERDYYLVYVPANALGRLVARDADGREIASRVIPIP
ncbi:MAG TPA: hypothetical protein VHN37_12990 [Actinomycetota bacterium]|nr:hypothetical protein [Actinomycetota bacterium]